MSEEQSWLTPYRDLKFNDGLVFVDALPNGTVFDDGEGGQQFVKMYDSPGSTYVRSLGKRHNVIDRGDGTTIEFDSPGGYIHISRSSRVKAVQGTPLFTGARTSRRGGKDPQEPLKPANPNTKRGKILAYLMKNLEGESSAARMCEEFGVNRSLLLTHCFEIHRDHGVGYSVNGDLIAIELPQGVSDPFKPIDQQPKGELNQ